MTLPQFRHCLVCEDVRLEIGNKFALLGFFGITPDVTIRLKTFDRHLPRLAFLILGGPCAETTTVKFTVAVFGPNGEPLFSLPEGELPLEKGKHANLAFAVGDLRLEGPGEYTLKAVADGTEVIKTTFRIEQGTAEDFA